MINDLITVAREASEQVLRIYRSDDFQARTKPDKTPVTSADHASHRYLKQALPALYDQPVVSEEDVQPYSTRKYWKEFWLIDPLDGTKNFLAKNDEYCICIALIRDYAPVLGLILAPALDELYYAEKGKGAFVVRGEKAVKLPTSKCEELVMAKSRFHAIKDDEEFAKINQIQKVETIGSALKFARLAEGKINLYPRYTACSEWDIAAGQIILQEAGCGIVDLITKQAPVFNQPEMTCHPFLAYGPEVQLDKIKHPERKR